MQTHHVKWLTAPIAVLAAALLGLSGCELCTDLNCDGGGGTVGELTFNSGLVFVTAVSRDVAGADQRDFAVTGRFTAGGGTRNPAVGPDGDSIVFATARGDALLRVATVGGASSTLATSDNTITNLRQPVFSIDGKRVFFTFDRGGVSGIGSVAADGTGGIVEVPRPLRAVNFTSPSFDLAGRLHAVANTPGDVGAELGRLDPITGDFLVLTRNLENALVVANRAQVSPNGTKIVFDGRVSSGATRLFIHAIGGGTVQLDVGAGNQSFPTWVKEDTLAFASDAGGADQIYLVKTTGGSAELVIPGGTEPNFGPH